MAFDIYDGKRTGVYVTQWNDGLLLGERSKGEELEEGVPRRDCSSGIDSVMAFIALLNNTCHLNTVKRVQIA